MNTIVKILLGIFIFISCLAIGIIVWIAIVLLIRKLAVENALLNKLGCGEYYCEPETIDLPIPEYTDSCSMEIARYCTDLILRVEKKTENEYKAPNNLTKELDLYIRKDSPVFGMVWSYINDGKKFIYVVYRGTLNYRDWIEDFSYNQNPFPTKKSLEEQQKVTFLQDTEIIPNVHNGFLESYKNFRNELIENLKETKPHAIIITGHSLGAAVATLCGLDIIKLGCCNNTIVYNFASPRVGDNIFANLVDTNLTLYRFVNTCDFIPTLPPSVCPNFDNPENPYMYEHCGKIIQFTSNWKSIVNNHLLNAYITFLDLKTPKTYI